MAIFPILELEKIVQVGDKTRLDGVKSFVSKGSDPVTKVEIKPETSEAFIDVTGTKQADWFLDWIYQTDGIKTVTIQVTTTMTAPPNTVTVETQSFDIEVITAEDDKLFSTDQDLIEYETDILKYVRPGRSSWLDYHRKAQELIVDFMNKRGSRDVELNKFTKDNFVDILEVREWSTALTLSLIYRNLSNAVDDIFDRKHRQYDSKVSDARSRLFVAMDLDLDGTVDKEEGVFMESGRLLRR